MEEVVYNDPPAPPVFSLTASTNTVSGSITRNPYIYDLSGYIVQVSKASDFLILVKTLELGDEATFSFVLDDNDEHFVRIATRDSFGDEGLIWSSPQSVWAVGRNRRATGLCTGWTGRLRTDDLPGDNRALYQLSYSDG